MRSLLQRQTALSADMAPPASRQRESVHPQQQLQKAIGHQALTRRMQAKGRGSQAGDRWEQEADAVAKSTVRNNEAVEIEGSGQPAARHEHLPGGELLATTVRAFFEPKLGRDFSDVQIHRGAKAERAAQASGALAFASGSDIVFGSGQYAPGGPTGMELLGHELSHVVQQDGGGRAVQKQPAPNKPDATMGTPEQMEFFLTNPALETDTSLRAAVASTDRYQPSVSLQNVQFRLMKQTASYVGTGLFEDGRSIWEGNTPVIELTQEKFDVIANHLAGTAPLTDVYDVVRTVGHEMYHLYRARTGHQSNPLMPLYQAEADRRMEQIRQNWVEWAKDPGTHRELGIPRTQAVTKWEDIPPNERKKIEDGATQTSQIQGLFEQSAYLVEEMFDKVEEISYLRVEQSAGSEYLKPSQARVSDLAALIYRLSTALDQSTGNVDFMTPALLQQTRTAMLQYLRKRYPNRSNPKMDSYAVIFYLTAMRSGLPPIYDGNGKLISVPPPGARVP